VQEAVTAFVWQLLRHWKDAGLLVASGVALAVCKAPPQVAIPGSKVAPGGTYSTYITKHDLGQVKKVCAVVMWMKWRQGAAASLAAVATGMADPEVPHWYCAHRRNSDRLRWAQILQPFHAIRAACGC
jgi:hypothetical protein